MIETPRWKALSAAGASPQRLLWASTGTKDPAYSDVLYVETLIGPDTISTMPPKTLDAFRDHGRVAPTLARDTAGAEAILREADALGLDLDGVTDDLIRDGVTLFAKAFDDLRKALDDKRRRLGGKASAQAAQA
jgi:transaldolase/glucose-6-phosphate isomerase